MDPPVKLEDDELRVYGQTLIIKSLLSSLFQREGIYPSLAKRGVGRFFDNDSLRMHSLVNLQKMDAPIKSEHDE
jgi:hypothetical protein